MSKAFIYLACIVVTGVTSCKTSRTASSIKGNGKIDITFVQVNDVYEIAPLEGGKAGGMARVATLKKEQLALNPHTFLIMAGDFVSPSVYNSLKYEGKRIRGRQMIEVMNAAGMDIAIFGNHEFDITENELQERVNESQFQWVSSNTFHKSENGVLPFVKSTSTGSEPFPETYIMTVKDEDGATARIGFLALTLPFNKANYVSYTDPLITAETLYHRIKDSCDAVVAITHQLIQDDSILARRLPDLAVIIGGHEHDMRFKKVGEVYITKAHANAKSAYIINLTINKKKNRLKVKPQLKMIDESVAIDSSTNVVVQKWMGIGEKNYSSLGFDATEIVLQSGKPLDGRETEIRSKPTNFSKIIVAAMQQAAPDADIVLLNAGSIRVDDIVQMPVTQYDIIRSLPFGGKIMEVDMKGSLLIKTLEAGRNNAGTGGFLHFPAGVNYNGETKTLSIKNVPLDSEKIYKVALSDFLMTGGEANMDFLTKDNQEAIKVYPLATDVTDLKSDIRLAIIKYMKNMK